MLERFARFSLAISEIDRCWHKLAAEEMSKYELNSPHAVYLTTLYRYADGITAAKLGELCGKNKADVSRMIAILEKKGLSKLLHLTWNREVSTSFCPILFLMGYLRNCRRKY